MRQQKTIIKEKEWSSFIKSLRNPQLRDNVLKIWTINAYHEIDGATALVEALKGHADLDHFKFLLEQKADVNQCDANDLPPLYYAVSHQSCLLKSKGIAIAVCFQWEFTRLLVEHKAEINYLPTRNFRFPDFIVKDEDQKLNNTSVLSIASIAYNANFPLMDYLLAHKADPNLKGDLLQVPPLYVAAELGRLEYVKSLLKHPDIRVNITTAQNETPLHIASENQQLSIVRALLKAKADVNSKAREDRTPLSVLVEGAQADCDETLEKLLQLLIQSKAQLDSVTEGRTALGIAARNNNLRMTQVLLEQRANPNEPVTVVSQDPKEGKVEYQSTILHVAINQSAKTVIELLLRHRADPLNKDARGRSPLDHVVYLGREQLVRKMIKAAGDLSARKRVGERALSSAVQLEKPMILRSLLNHPDQFDVNARSGNLTLLHQAAIRGNRTILGLLVDAKADVNNKMGEARTPLVSAAAQDQIISVSYLLSCGADPDIADPENISPLYIAFVNGHARVVELLLQKHYRKIYHHISDEKFDAMAEDVITVCTLSSQAGFEEIASAFKKLIISLSFYVHAIKTVHTMLDETLKILDSSSALSAPQFTKKLPIFDEAVSLPLDQIGYPKEKRRALRAKTQKSLVESVGVDKKSDTSAETKAIQWLGGSICSEMDEVALIEPEHLGIYLYMDYESLSLQGCGQGIIELFDNLRKKFSAKEGEIGIKPLKKPFFTAEGSIEGLAGKKEYPITHELKIIHKVYGEARILCLELASNLLAACLYEPRGLHSKKTLGKLKSSNKKQFMLRMPKARSLEDRDEWELGEMDSRTLGLCLNRHNLWFAIPNANPLNHILEYCNLPAIR